MKEPWEWTEKSEVKWNANKIKILQILDQLDGYKLFVYFGDICFCDKRL